MDTVKPLITLSYVKSYTHKIFEADFFLCHYFLLLLHNVDDSNENI